MALRHLDCLYVRSLGWERWDDDVILVRGRGLLASPDIVKLRGRG